MVLHDYCDAMTGRARERLSRFGDRVSYRRADMSQQGWTAGMGGPFDAVVSALAIRIRHRGRSLDPRRVVARWIRDRMHAQMAVMRRTSSGAVATTSAVPSVHCGMGVVLALEDGQSEPRMGPDVAEPGRAAERGQPERLRV